MVNIILFLYFLKTEMKNYKCSLKIIIPEYSISIISISSKILILKTKFHNTVIVNLKIIFYTITDKLCFHFNKFIQAL